MSTEFADKSWAGERAARRSARAGGAAGLVGLAERRERVHDVGEDGERHLRADRERGLGEPLVGAAARSPRRRRARQPCGPSSAQEPAVAALGAVACCRRTSCVSTRTSIRRRAPSRCSGQRSRRAGRCRPCADRVVLATRSSPVADSAAGRAQDVRDHDPGLVVRGVGEGWRSRSRRPPPTRGPRPRPGSSDRRSARRARREAASRRGRKPSTAHVRSRRRSAPRRGRSRREHQPRSGGARLRPFLASRR